MEVGLQSFGGPMKRKGKESKLNLVLSILLVFFVCLLTFSIGVISGKGWSDREYKVRHIENDSHLKAAMQDNEPLGDEMTQKEVELLTKRALEEAKAEQPEMPAPQREVASTNKPNQNSEENTQDKGDNSKSIKDSATPMGREASTASNNTDPIKKGEGRKVSSLIPQPSTPKPASIEYTVQVAAYKTLKEAENHSQKLIDKGFPAFPVKAFIKGKPWYRVSIGSFKNRKQAIKYEKALKKQAVVVDTFVKKITRLKK